MTRPLLVGLVPLAVACSGSSRPPAQVDTAPSDTSQEEEAEDEVTLPPELDLDVAVTLDGEPAADVRVGQPGTDRYVMTDSSGAATLTIDTTIHGSLAVAASHPDARIKGEEFYKEVPESIELALERFDKGDNRLYVFQDSGTPERSDNTNYCSHCHQTFVFDWWDSPHRSATSNVVVHDLYAGVAAAWSEAAACEAAGGVMRTGLEPGTGATVERCYLGEGVLPALNDDCGVTESCDGVAELTGACADCHAPAIDGELGGRDLLEAGELAYETGIGCDVCHKVESVDLDAVEPGVAGRLQIVRPTEEGSPSFGDYAPLTFGPYHDVLNPRMGSVYRDHYTNGELCAGCHEYEQEVLVSGGVLDETRWPEGRLPVHSTWSEWAAGPLGDAVSCNACHMPPASETGNGADLGNYISDDWVDTATGWFREPGAVRKHAWYGPRSETERMLDLAASVSLEVSQADDAVSVAASVANVGPAHAIPTGEPLRHMLLVVDATCDGDRLTPTAGDVVPDYGGSRARKEAGEDWTTWSDAEVGDRIRVLARSGEWHDYTGFGPFGDGSFDAEAKGLAVEEFVGEVEILGVDSDAVTLSAELPDGDLAVLVRDGGEVPADGGVPSDLAGRPGFGFARVMVGPDGARMVPHFLAVDIASDNRLLPGSSWRSEHTFEGCAEGELEVIASLVYRRLPIELAEERGWEVADQVMASVTWALGASE